MQTFSVCSNSLLLKVAHKSMAESWTDLVGNPEQSDKYTCMDGGAHAKQAQLYIIKVTNTFHHHLHGNNCQITPCTNEYVYTYLQPPCPHKVHVSSSHDITAHITIYINLY